MYIDKWWYDFIGGSHDSLVLPDYFDSTEEVEYSISKILANFHIDSREVEYFRGAPLFFIAFPMVFRMTLILSLI